jgi:Leukotriene A4 hydrolase, C-terminal
MLLQRRACEIVDGADVTALETAAGRELLRATYRDYGISNPIMRLVAPCEAGVDPDEVYTDVAYEGGFAFLRYLKATIAQLRPDTAQQEFDGWLHKYFDRYAFKTVTVAGMIESFFDSFPELKGDWSLERWLKEEKEETSYWNAVHHEIPADLEAVAESSLPPLDVNVADEKGRRGLAYRKGYEFGRWLFASGFPPFYPSCKAGDALQKPAEALAAAWLAKAKTDPSSKPEGADAFASWPTLQKLAFLDALLLSAEHEVAAICPPRATTEQVAAAPSKLGAALQPWNRLLVALDATYGFASSKNAEIRLRFSRLIADTVTTSLYPSVVDFLGMTGKLKYVTPTFRSLAGAPPAPGAEGVKLQERPGWKLAVETYKKIKPTLHPVVQGRLEGVFAGYHDVHGETLTW